MQELNLAQVEEVSGGVSLALYLGELAMTYAIKQLADCL